MSSRNQDDYFDDEAERDDDLDTRRKFEDSSEEDEDDVDDYEKDDFIVDEPEEYSDEDGGEDDMDDSRVSKYRKKEKRKRRMYREDSPELAEGDLQLLREKGLQVPKKKLRRLRKGASDDDEPDDLDYRDFGDDYADDEEREREGRREIDEQVDFDDEMGDFIDDGGRGRRRRAAERKGLISSETFHAARSLFGDGEDMTIYKGLNKSFQSRGDPDDLEDEDDSRAHGSFLDDDDDDDGDDDRPSSIRRRIGRQSRGQGEGTDTESAIRAIAATNLHADGAVKPKIAARFVTPDVPEALINHFGTDYSTPSQAAIKREAEWIYKYGFRDDPNVGAMQFDPDKVIEKIGVFLQYVHKDKLDIPFIAMYRKDYITPELIYPVGECFHGQGQQWDSEPRPEPYAVKGFNSYEYDGLRPGLSVEHLRGVPPGYDDGFGDWSTLWKIMDWDKKYANLGRRRKRLTDSTDAAAQKNVPESVIQDMIEAAKASENELQIADCERFLRLAVDLAIALKQHESAENPELVNEEDEKSARRPSRRRFRYGEFCRKGYRALSELFGLSAHQFGENVNGGFEFGEEFQMHVPVDADEEPLEAARLFEDRLRESSRLETMSIDDGPSRLLAAARHILVKEMSAQLAVIRTARMILAKEGTVTIDTNPTPQGIAEVDDTHYLRPVTCIGGKKIERLANTVEFALVLRAIELGYTELKINFQEEQVHALARILQRSFSVQTNSSTLSEKWNAERMVVVEEVLVELKKQISMEIRGQLMEKTFLALSAQMTQAASRRLLLGPARPYRNEDGAPKVLAICVTKEEDEEPDRMQVLRDMEEAAERGQPSSRRPAPERITFVVVDENGEYVSSQELFGRWLSRPIRQPLSEAVSNQLKAYLAKTKPQTIVIGVGSGGRSAVRLRDDMRQVLADMLKTDHLGHMVPPDERKGYDPNGPVKNAFRVIDPYVVCVDEWPARMYSHCKWASVGLPVDGMTLLEKRAIALGRLAQEPLTIYTGICSDPQVSPKFKLHQFHYFLKPRERIETLRRALVRSVCTTGVDINRVLSVPHLKPLVPFVGGLGEHKANALIRDLEAVLSEEDKGLRSRKHLWTKEFMGRIVFMSAAAFLRVRDPELHSGGSTSRAVEFRRRRLERRSRSRRMDEDDEDAFYDPMDDSRIHPEHYAVAIKIADEALRDDEGILRIELSEGSGVSDAMRVTAAVLDDPSGLQRLALDQYADRLDNLGRGKLYETVKLIAREFYGTFRDFRRPLVSPTPQALFYMVTGADPLQFRIGSKATATNCRVGKFDIICHLPHNLFGKIEKIDFSDDALEDSDVMKLMSDGSSLGCRIIGFDFDKFLVKLTSKTSCLSDPTRLSGYVELVDKSDDSYRPYPVSVNGSLVHGMQGLRATGLAGQNAFMAADEAQRRKTARLRLREKSIVNHSLFRDISGSEAVDSLRNALPGDVLIRPSQLSKDKYSFSCKFATLSPSDSDIPRDIFHIEFRTEANPGNSKAPLRLKIGTEVFEHVDEVIEHFLHPIISNLKEGLEHRKYMAGSEEEMKRFVVGKKKENPKAIPYQLGLSEKKELHLFIAYVPGRSTPVCEHIRVVPNGYIFRSVLHKNLDVLVEWFKKNMRAHSDVRPSSAIRRDTVGASPFATPGTPRARPSMAVPQGATPVAGDPAPPPLSAVGGVPFANPVSTRRESTSADKNGQEEGTVGRDGSHGPTLGSLPSRDARPPFTASRSYDWGRAVPSADVPPPSAHGGDFGGRPPRPSAVDIAHPPPSVPPREHRMDDGRRPPPRDGEASRYGPRRGSRQTGPPSPRRRDPRDDEMPEWRGPRGRAPIPAWAQKQKEHQGTN